MRLQIILYIFLLLILNFLNVTQSIATELEGRLKKAQNEGKTVMLQVGFEGCIPCDEMKPILNKLSKTYKGRLEVIYIDIKKDKDSLKKYKVYMTPTQIFIDKNGKEFYRHLGYYPYEEIVKVLKRAGI